MTTESFEADGTAPRKKFSLLDLMPEKRTVETSLGKLYVRHAYASDRQHFQSENPEERGRMVVQRLTSRGSDKEDDTPLSDDDLGRLTNTDFEALAAAIAVKCGWGELPTGPVLVALSQLTKLAEERERTRYAKQLAEMRKSVDDTYGFAGKDTLERLKSQLTGISDFRQSLRTGIPDYLKNITPRASTLEQAIRNASLTDPLKGLGATMFEAPLRNLHPVDSLKELNEIELKKAIHSAGLPDPLAQHAALSAEIQKSHTPQPSFPASSILEGAPMPDIYLPPRLEDTKLSRAAIETAQNTENLAALMQVLTNITTGLQETLLTEVLPAWLRQAETMDKAGNASLAQAARSLWWTKWAIGASIFTTIAVTWWQVDVAQKIDSENNKQQQRVEALLQRQITAHESQTRQEEQNARELRAVIQTTKMAASTATTGSKR